MSLTTNKSTSTTGQDFTSSTSEAFEDINIGKARSREQNGKFSNFLGDKCSVSLESFFQCLTYRVL